jgi:hypothetical protein
LCHIRVASWYIFKPKIPIWVILEGLAMEDVGTFYGHLVYFVVIWYILLPFGKFYGYLLTFSSLVFFYQEKIWQPWP